MALGPRSRQKPRPTASVFVYMSPSVHVINIAMQAMIKTFMITYPCWNLSQSMLVKEANDLYWALTLIYGMDVTEAQYEFSITPLHTQPYTIHSELINNYDHQLRGALVLNTLIPNILSPAVKFKWLYISDSA